MIDIDKSIIKSRRTNINNPDIILIYYTVSLCNKPEMMHTMSEGMGGPTYPRFVVQR